MKKKKIQHTASAGSDDFAVWFTDNQQRFVNLKEAVVSITTSLLTDNQIDFLAIDGRVKDVAGAIEKVTRKGYDDPIVQMTDIAGVRVIVYFESDVIKVADIIRKSFQVDEKNSSNTDDRMSADQVGYRSVHFVCDLGKDRIKLPEFSALGGLKFEFQVRTVLQHAWAELAHDRNYKFSGTLPRHLKRRLFLLAGLLETADRGFDDLSTSLDDYVKSVSEDSAKGALDIEINSVSLVGFVEQWAKQHDIALQRFKASVGNDVIKELNKYGITTLAELKEIIPPDFAERSLATDRHTVVGLVRRWMIIHDPKRFTDTLVINWSPGEVTRELIRRYYPDDATRILRQIAAIKKKSA